MPTDLTECKTFQDGIARRVRTNPVLRKQFDPETAYLEVIPEAQRIIIGKAVYLRDEAMKRPDKNWLLESFEYGKRAFYSILWVIVTGKARPPKRDDTQGAADRVPLPEMSDTSQLNNLTDLHSGDDGSLAEELMGEGKEPSPVAGATAAQLRDDIAKLPPKERQVIVLKYDEDKEWGEIAVAMECSISEAKSYCKSAKNKLRRKWIDD